MLHVRNFSAEAADEGTGPAMSLQGGGGGNP